MRGKLLEASTSIVTILVMRNDALIVHIQRQITAGLLPQQQAGVSQQRRDFSAAEELTKQALTLASTFDSPEIAYLWQWQLGRAIQGDRDGAIAAYSAAFYALKSLRGDLVVREAGVRFTFRESVEPLYRELVTLLLREEEPPQEYLARAREVIEALQLAELNDYFRDPCIDAKPEQVDKVVEESKVPTAFLYVVTLEDRLEVILALSGEKKLQHHNINISQDEVSKVLIELRKHLPNVTQTSRVKQLSGRLYEWLIRPIQHQLQKKQVQILVFVLDGLMRNIPMAVLYDAKRNKYLVADYAIARAPGLQLVSPQPLVDVKLSALAAGVSKERRLQGRYFPEILQVPRELNLVQSAVPNRRELLLNEAFKKEQLQKELNTGNFTIVHVSTHASFGSDPENTFVLTWEELLNVQQLDNLVRIKRGNETIPIELLVLSACQTAKGDERAALGLAGVAVRAGARSTLATLWPVYDESTAELMGEFYKALINTDGAESRSKAQALREAQLTFLAKKNDPGKNWSRPYFWAPFILLGNWL